MVRTDEMWRYPRTIEVKHCHEIEDEQWAVLSKVENSKVQGWDIYLSDGCKLQSCFAETEYEVRMI